MLTHSAAKVSFALAERIYEHAMAEGWLAAGDTVLDPFAGIAGFAYHALVNGLHFVGCELEPRFVMLGQQNIALWNARYNRLPHWGTAQIIQGDSRQLAALLGVGQATGVVTSPPYAEAQQVDNRTKLSSAMSNTWRKRFGNITDGTTPGNLGNMRGGGFDAAVSSPPYVHRSYEGLSASYAEWREMNGRDNSKPGTQAIVNGYLDAAGQLAGSNDFWPAARAIVDQVYQVLKPGGHAIFVLKAYVRAGKIVDFPGQWKQLCESAGFETLHEHRAWLVEERGTQHTLDNGTETKVVQRLSFFRRLHAKKYPHLLINHEIVLCMRRRETL